MTLAIMVLIFIVITSLGAPVFVSLAGAGLLGNIIDLGIKGTFAPIAMFSANDSWPILAAPFFLLSGNIMGKCGPAEALFDLCDNFLGHIKGGICYAVIMACVFFGAVTGSAIATALAIGGIAIPEMLKRGYSKPLTFGLVAVAGTLGLMIPPSIYMVLFAGVANGDILEYFTAGYVPGLIMAGVLCMISFIKTPTGLTMAKANWHVRGHSILKALPALGMPITVMGAIYTGIFTPTESAALSVLYCVVICPIFYKSKWNFKTFYDSCTSALASSGQIYIILGAVQIFSIVLTYMQVPQMIASYASASMIGPVGMLFIFSIIFLFFGMIIDAIPIMYLTIPIFLPVLVKQGIDPTVVMIITVFNMMIAQITPPFGVILFALSGAFNEKVETIVRGAIPFMAATIALVILIIFFPQIATFLPDLVLK